MTTTWSVAEPDPPADETVTHLADLLEAGLRAERTRPGSAATVLDAAPSRLRARLEGLLVLGHLTSTAYE